MQNDDRILAEINRRLARIERKLSGLLQTQKQLHWAKVGFVEELTGWDRDKMRRARDQGLVKWKDDPIKGRLYLLESIPQLFIKRQSHGEATDGTASI